VTCCQLGLIVVWITSISGEINMSRILAMVFLILLGNGAGYATEPSLRLIVFPFEGSTKENSLSWLNEGIAYSIGQQIEVRGVTVLDHKEVASLVESMDLPPGAQLSHASMIRAAQRASASLIILGAYSGTRQNLKITAKTLDMKTLRLSGSMDANGPVTFLPQMENELAWLILNNTGLEKTISREKFQLKTRKAPNQAYAQFIESLSSANENSRLALLLKSVELYHNFREAHQQLGSIYFQKGNCQKAMPHLTLGQSEGNDDPENEFMRGTCYLQDDLPMAIQTLSHLAASFRTFEVLNNLGIAYIQRADYGLALNALSDARNLARSDSTVARNVAIVRHLQGNDVRARFVVDEALKLHPRDGMLQFLSGFLLQARGEKEKAAVAFSNAKMLGMNVDKLQVETPKAWTQIIFEMQPSKALP
jgi:Flp pilus assembly protein TadD